MATLVLDRPKMHNAMNRALVAQLSQACAELDADAGVHVVVITGAGKSFCSGMDRAEPPTADLQQLVIDGFGDREALYRLRKPTIAAVSGAAFGSGFELALCADILLADTTASFALPEITFNGMPGAGGTVRLAARAGLQHAMEICCSGRRVSSDEALALGIAMQVHEPARLLPEATALAARMAAQSLAPLMLIKQGLRSAQQAALASSLPLQTLASYTCILGRAVPART
ncbi:MAG: enoyl-CoA hydratase/isomerase family protein [Lautropia sp.]